MDMQQKNESTLKSYNSGTLVIIITMIAIIITAAIVSLYNIAHIQ